MGRNKTHRLAYLIHTFPLYSLTFVVDEVDSLRKRGARIDLFAVRRPSATEYPESYERLVRETRYVLPANAWRHLVKHLALAVRHPLRYFSCWRYIFGVRDLRFRQRFKLCAYFSEAVELAKWIRPEVYGHLHVHFLFGGALIAIFLKKIVGVGYSVTAHGSDFLVENFMLKEKIAHADFVRVGTRFNARYLSDFVATDSRNKLFVLPFGVRVDPPPLSFGRANDFQEGRQGVRVINVGRLVWQKGQADLIEAARSLRDDGVAFTLDIIGEGELRPELESLITRYGLAGTVTLRGALAHKNVLEEMRQSDIFAFSSHSEGFGLVLLEAMACGLAVVAPAITGVGEIVEDGRTGVLYPSRDPRALTEALGSLINDAAQRNELGRNGRERVLKHFDHEDLCGQLRTKLEAHYIR